MSLPSINFLHITVSEIYHGQYFIRQGHYGKVKSRSRHDVAHLHPLTNVPTKYQLPTPYGLRDIAWTRFSNSRSLRQGQIKSHHDIAHLHPLTNVPARHQLPTPYVFWDVPRTNFFPLPARTPIRIPWVKTIPQQHLVHKLSIQFKFAWVDFKLNWEILI